MGNIKILDCALSDMECSTGEAYGIMGKTPQSEPSCRYGDILKVSPEGITAACSNSSILLKTLQIPGKKAVSGADFANRLKQQNKTNLQGL